MCTYCGCEAIGSIGRLMAEHTAIINTLTALRQACESGDGDAVREAARHVATHLDPHTGKEEHGIFAVLSEQDDLFAGHVSSLCAEHTMLDALLADIAGGAHHRAGEFENALHDHIDKEDNGLFPAAAIALDGPDWERVDELEAAFGTAAHGH